MLPLMRDSLDELFFSLDTRQLSPIHSWPTLHALSESCVRWSSAIPSVSSIDSKNKQSVKETIRKTCSKNMESRHTCLSPADIKQLFLNYHKENDQNGENESIMAKDDLLEGNDLYSLKQELLPVSRAALSVIQCCVHHLSASSQQVQLLVLEALANVINSLKYDQVYCCVIWDDSMYEMVGFHRIA